MAKVPQPAWHEERAKILLSRISVDGIVLHDTAGTGTHRDTLYLRDSPEKGRKVSVDFTVERDGSIWKLNPDLRKYACAHAGRATAFKGKRNGQVTRSTIGIEICQKVDLSLVPVWPVEQVRAVAELCWWLVNEFGLTTADITTHRQIIQDGSRTDPRMPFGGKDGFWFHYWDVQGKGETYLASLTTPIRLPSAPTPPQPPVEHTAREVQIALVVKGYKLPRFGTDGNWGNESIAALVAFQRDAGLPRTGKRDAATLEKLFNA